MKRSLFVLLATASIGYFTGCCCHHGTGWGGFRYPTGNPCPGGVCPPGGTYSVPPGQSSYYSNTAVESVQMGVPQPIEGPVTYAPVGYPVAPILHTAAMPLESLPTY